LSDAAAAVDADCCPTSPGTLSDAAAAVDADCSLRNFAKFCKHNDNQNALMKDVYISHAEYGISKAMNFNFGTQIAYCRKWQYLRNGAKLRHCCYRTLIGRDIWPIK